MCVCVSVCEGSVSVSLRPCAHRGCVLACVCSSRAACAFGGSVRACARVHKGENLAAI